jgi:hypothetical protein
MARICVGVLIAGAFLVIASFLVGGRYTAVATPRTDGSSLGGFLFVVDRFTGAVSVCDKTGCMRVHP